MPGRAPGPPNRQADNQRTVGSGLTLSRPSAPGASGQHSHPSLAGWALESPVCTSRSIWSKEGSWDGNPEGPASTLLPAPPLVNPAALSKDTSEAVQLSWLPRNCTDPATPTPGRHRMNSQGHTCLSSVFLSLMYPPPPPHPSGWPPHSNQFPGKAWVSPMARLLGIHRLGPAGHYLVTCLRSPTSFTGNGTTLTSYPVALSPHLGTEETLL